MNELDEPKTMTYREAARFLGIKINSIYPLVTRGRLHPISVEGSQVKLLVREEVERYARRETQSGAERLAPLAEEVEHYAIDTADWLASEASDLGAVFTSAWLHFHGVIDSGDAGISPRLLEQVARLRRNVEGRATLAGLAASILAMLEDEPLKSAPSLATERARLVHLYGVISAALAEPITRRHVKKSGEASPASSEPLEAEPRADQLARAK